MSSIYVKTFDYSSLINYFIDAGSELVKYIDFNVIFESNEEKLNIESFLSNPDDYAIHLELVINNKAAMNIIIKDLCEKLFLNRTLKCATKLSEFCITCHILNTLLLNINQKLEYKINDLFTGTKFIIKNNNKISYYENTYLRDNLTLIRFIRYLYTNAFTEPLKLTADYYYYLSKHSWKSPFKTCISCGRIIKKSELKTITSHCDICKGDTTIITKKVKYDSTRYAYSFFKDNLDILKKYYPNADITNIIENNTQSVCIKKHNALISKEYKHLKSIISMYRFEEDNKKK